MLYPGQPIPISNKNAEWLGDALSDHIDTLEADHSQYFRDINIWWDWYDAKPRSSAQNFPFMNASNVVVPLIKGQSNAMVNRLYGTIFSAGERIWTGRTENEDLQQTVRDILRFINWAANDNDFDFRTPINEWLDELVVVGSSVLALNWRDDMRPVFADPRGRKAQMISYRRGPLFEHIPRQQILWDTAHRVGDAPCVVREMHFSWSQINALATQNGWFKDQVLKVQTQEGLDSPGGERLAKAREKEGLSNSAPDTLHDIREVHVDWPLLKAAGANLDLPNNEKLGMVSPPLVAVVHRQTRRLLHLKAEPYNLPYKPFFDGYFRKRAGRSHSYGLAKDLFSMQLTMTTLLNQSIDARTRANAVWAKTSRRELMQRPIDPSVPMYVPEGSSFEPLNLQTNPLQDISIFNIANIMAERLTGQADPVMGRESRSGGHPSPATSTLALLNQSEEMSGTTREGIRNTVARMGEAIAVLYQQFETNENQKIERVLGGLDAKRVNEFLFPTDPLIGLMKFDVVGMSDTSNPQAEISRMIQLRQSNMNYWAFLGQAVQALVQARQAGLKDIEAMVIQSIMAQTKFETRVLEIGGIDDTERFVAQLKDSFTAGGGGQLAQPQPGQGQAGPGAGPAPGAGVAGLNGSAGGGAPPILGRPRLQ